MFNSRRNWNLLVLAVLLLGLLPLTAMAQPGPQPDWAKVEPSVMAALESDGEAGFFIILTAQADLSGAEALKTKVERTTYVFEHLRAVADQTQGPVMDYLRSQGVSGESYYIQNMVEVAQAGRAVVEGLVARADVAGIMPLPNPQLDPVYEGMSPEERHEAIEWNILRVHAPDVWAMGIHGEGMVVGDNDTGAQYDHPAVVNQYRGNLGGGNFDHNYNWWDDWGGSPSPVPVDYDGHGTHTLGTMIGDDGGANQIGVAPGAQWIACAGLSLGCLEFFLTPTDLDGQNPMPELAPDTVNNSWYDPSGFDYRPIIQAMNAAGIAVIKSAGNAGPGCSTISNPGYVPEIIATAAFDSGDNIASFSSRGPMSNYGETILKPEVAAPGVSVRSSYPTNTYSYLSGTSMAAPHSTATVALIWSAAPCLQGDVPTTKDIMMWTAESKIDAQCPPFVDHPNDVWGWGILDDLAAVQAAIEFCGGLGTLEGTVTDAGSGDPLEGVEVRAEAGGGYYKVVTTDAAGFYTMDIPADTYDVTATVYGYEPGMVSGVVVEVDTTTVQDLALTALPIWTVDGYVLDAVTLAPLYAEVYFKDAPVDPVFTDPGTGYYSIEVAEGTWNLRAKADLHLAETHEVMVYGNISEDFYLQPLPCILLVDDDGDGPDVRAYYTDALDELGLDFAIWDVLSQGDPQADDLAGYNMVFWFNGYPYSNTFTPDNEAAVGAYLDAGGQFFFSSQDYLYDYGLTPFGEDYLHIASYTSDVSQTTVTGQNVFAGLGPYSLSYPFTNYSDIVNPDAQAQVAFVGNQGNAAISFDGGSFRTIFLGFPFEAIPNLADRADVMATVVDWFGGCEPPPEDTMHVGGIEGYFSMDYMGRPVLRIHVLAEDQNAVPLSDVAVDASIWVPDGGPFQRMRYTKPSGYARFHWGSNASGTWTICVDNLTLAGYIYNPGDNVVTCMDWYQ